MPTCICGGKRVAGWQAGLGIAAAERNRASVICTQVTKRITHCDSKALAVPATVAGNPVTAIDPATEDATTVMPDCEPSAAALLESRTVIDCEPAVFKVATKVCDPASAAVKV